MDGNSQVRTASQMHRGADLTGGLHAGRTTFAGALWARGNCWVTMFIPEFIDLLDLAPGDHFREFLVGTLLAQVSLRPT